jgi:hypothetical protein
MTSNKIEEPADRFISFTHIALCPEDSPAAEAKDKKTGHYARV